MNKESVVFKGVLISSDQVMNLVLSPATVIKKVNENEKSTEEKDLLIYIRGEDVCWIAPSVRSAYHLVSSYDPLQPNEVNIVE